MWAPAHELASMRDPILANACGTTPLGRFFSCWHRVALVLDLFRNMVSRRQVVLLLIWLRTSVGLRPSVGEGTDARGMGMSPKGVCLPITRRSRRAGL
jgi:hypothetical protein